MTQQTIRTFRANLQLSASALCEQMKKECQALHRANTTWDRQDNSYAERVRICQLERHADKTYATAMRVVAKYSLIPNAAAKMSDFDDLRTNYATGKFTIKELALNYELPMDIVEQFLLKNVQPVFTSHMFA